MRKLKVALPAILLGAGFIVCTTASYGKPEYAKKEDKKCVYCHAKVEAKDAMPKNLTAAGKYYQTHNHSLEGYTEKK